MKTFTDIAGEILSQPTAPFFENAVRDKIRELLKECRNVRVEQDAFGNLIAEYKGGQAVPKYAFAAHMDHPAYVGDEFLGGVPERYRAKNPPRKSFGPYSMWDLPAFEIREGRIYSRACDDLIGCAAIVWMLLELDNAKAECCAYGLFTRAEEVGFVGAIQLAKSKCLPAGITIVSLETSSEKGGPVTMGQGVIIRTGDRTSVFDSAASLEMLNQAKAANIPYQRALMQGGTCEATAYALYDYRTAGLCVALGNYHNCGPDDLIAPEYVSVDDAEGMAKLCVALAKNPAGNDPLKSLRERLETEMEQYRKYF